jgi:hypothetical protein
LIIILLFCYCSIYSFVVLIFMLHIIQQMQSINSFAQEREKLLRVGSILDDLHTQQVTASNSMLAQRARLSGAHRTLLDVGNSLGLSSSVLRMIAKKENFNAMLTYGCMLLTLLIMGITFYYFRYLPAHQVSISVDTPQAQPLSSSNVISDVASSITSAAAAAVSTASNQPSQLSTENGSPKLDATGDNRKQGNTAEANRVIYKVLEDMKETEKAKIAKKKNKPTKNKH